MRCSVAAAMMALALGFVSAMAGAQVAGGGFFNDGFETRSRLPMGDRQAARLLTQASFGPTLDEIGRLRSLSVEEWLEQQLALPATLHLPLIEQRIAEQGIEGLWQDARREEWFRAAMVAPDQLRQRMAYALSQILVVSEQNGALEGHPVALTQYYDLLVQHAFGNYRDLLEAVTLHPAMGAYLSMLRNRKQNQIATIRPDENYAREIMQLFSVGLIELNPDGSPVDGDPGQPGVQTVPTYDQETIRGLAAVFTGWNVATCRPQDPDWNVNRDSAGQIVEYERWWEWEYCPLDPSYDDGNPGNDVDFKLAAAVLTPMAAWNSYHQSVGAKQLLRYPGVARGRVDSNGVLASGGTATENLAAALDNLFQHPNVGPFLARRLIQRLITSNPSPAYVARVAAAFADDNGDAAGGIRGSLAAMARAIVLDPEAREPTTAACSGPQAGCVGKLREPLLRLTQLYRALQGSPTHPAGYWTEAYTSYFSGQAALASPSVFNFYHPDYALPGADIADRGLVSPEFQITIDTFITRMSDELGGRIGWQWAGNPGLPSEGHWRPNVISLEREMAIADDPEALIDRLALLFTAGQLSPAVRQLLVEHVANEPFYDWRSDTETRRIRVQDALWLLLVSPDYVVEK